MAGGESQVICRGILRVSDDSRVVLQPIISDCSRRSRRSRWAGSAQLSTKWRVRRQAGEVTGAVCESTNVGNTQD